MISHAAQVDRAPTASRNPFGSKRLAHFLAVAALVAAGFTLAWPFRHAGQRLEKPGRDYTILDVPLRRQDILPEPGTTGQRSPAAPLEETDRCSTPEPVARVDCAAPPNLPRDFSAAAGQQGLVIRADWQPARLKMPSSQPAFLRHRLTDGDSLERLAERYLQDAARAGEIYDANRDILSAPDLLPLGKIIRIPPLVRGDE